MAEEKKVEIAPDFEGARRRLEETYPDYLTWSGFRTCGGSGGPYRAPGYSREKIAKMSEKDLANVRIQLAFYEVATNCGEPLEGMVFVGFSSRAWDHVSAKRNIYLVGRPYRQNPRATYEWDPPVIWGFPESPLVLEE